MPLHVFYQTSLTTSREGIISLDFETLPEKLLDVGTDNSHPGQLTHQRYAKEHIKNFTNCTHNALLIDINLLHTLYSS